MCCMEGTRVEKLSKEAALKARTKTCSQTCKVKRREGKGILGYKEQLVQMHAF